ncbi:MAG: hypothetical protein ACOCQR_02590 [bacterium]
MNNERKRIILRALGSLQMNLFCLLLTEENDVFSADTFNNFSFKDGELIKFVITNVVVGSKQIVDLAFLGTLKPLYSKNIIYLEIKPILDGENSKTIIKSTYDISKNRWDSFDALISAFPTLF